MSERRGLHRYNIGIVNITRSIDNDIYAIGKLGGCVSSQLCMFSVESLPFIYLRIHTCLYTI